MTVLAGFELPLEEEVFFEEQGGALGRPSLRGPARAALVRAVGLAEPAIVYEWFPCRRLSAGEVEVGDAVFKLGRHADLLEQARSALVALVTIGPRLEKEARDLQAAGRALDAYLLDSAGVFAVGLLLQKARRLVENEAAQRGWGVGAELAPGQLSGWSIEEQILVVRLLDIQAIGVWVTDSGMLVPQKSASLIVGIGPDYVSSEVCSPCEYCDVRETCRHRH